MQKKIQKTFSIVTASCLFLFSRVKCWEIHELISDVDTQNEWQRFEFLFNSMSFVNNNLI